MYQEFLPEPSGFAESTFQVVNRPNWQICPSSYINIISQDLVNSDTVITSGIVTLTATFDLSIRDTPTYCYRGLSDQYGHVIKYLSHDLGICMVCSFFCNHWDLYRLGQGNKIPSTGHILRNETIDISIAPTLCKCE